MLIKPKGDFYKQKQKSIQTHMIILHKRWIDTRKISIKFCFGKMLIARFASV